jgi:hypothetical protein
MINIENKLTDLQVNNNSSLFFYWICILNRNVHYHI